MEVVGDDGLRLTYVHVRCLVVHVEERAVERLDDVRPQPGVDEASAQSLVLFGGGAVLILRKETVSDRVEMKTQRTIPVEVVAGKQSDVGVCVGDVQDVLVLQIQLLDVRFN